MQSHDNADTILNDTPAEAIDPAVEKIRRKLTRLMFGSIALTMVLIIIVMAAVFYKLIYLGKQPSNSAPNSAISEVKIGLNSHIANYRIQAPYIIFHLKSADGPEEFIVYDFVQNKLVNQIKLTP